MLFKDWLLEQNLSHQKAAERIGCTRAACYHWARGINRPTAKWNAIISEVTGGAVLANDHQNAFLLREETV